MSELTPLGVGTGVVIALAFVAGNINFLVSKVLTKIGSRRTLLGGEIMEATTVMALLADIVIIFVITVWLLGLLVMEVLL